MTGRGRCRRHHVCDCAPCSRGCLSRPPLEHHAASYRQQRNSLERQLALGWQHSRRGRRVPKRAPTAGLGCSVLCPCLPCRLVGLLQHRQKWWCPRLRAASAAASAQGVMACPGCRVPDAECIHGGGRSCCSWPGEAAAAAASATFDAAAASVLEDAKDLLIPVQEHLFAVHLDQAATILWQQHLVALLDAWRNELASAGPAARADG